MHVCAYTEIAGRAVDTRGNQARSPNVGNIFAVLYTFIALVACYGKAVCC